MFYLYLKSLQLISGSTCSGAWLCLNAVDRLDTVALSMITPWIQQLQEMLKEMGEKKGMGRGKGRKRVPKGEEGEQNKFEIILPTCGKLTVSRYAFLCFIISPEYPGRYDLPSNLKVSMSSLYIQA